MAKRNYISLELKAIEDKMKEFRNYLATTPIKDIKEYGERHDEIKVQVLLLKELSVIAQQYDSIKKQAENELEQKATQDTRGDVPLSPLEEGLI